MNIQSHRHRLRFIHFLNYVTSALAGGGNAFKTAIHISWVSQRLKLTNSYFLLVLLSFFINPLMTMEVITSFTGPMGWNDSLSGKGGEEEGSTRNSTLQEIDAPSLPLSSDLENHHAPDSETPPLGDMSHVSSSSSEDDGRVVIPQVQHHSETVATTTPTTTTTTAGADAAAFSLRPQDYGLPGIIFFPDRPKHPTAFHTFISILLYPTIFEDLYGKALKTDVLGVTQVIAGVARSWETNMTTVRFQAFFFFSIPKNKA